MKFLFIVILVMVGLLALIRFGGIDLAQEYLSPSDPYADMRSPDWIHEHELPGDLAIDLPFRLKKSEGTPPKEAAYWAVKQEDQILDHRKAYIAAQVIIIRPASPFNLQGGANELINEIVEDKGGTQEQISLNPTTFMGRNAFVTTLDVGEGEDLIELHCLFTMRKNCMYAFTLGMPKDTPDLPVLWERYKSAIRLKTTPQSENKILGYEEDQTNPGNFRTPAQSEPGLPPGVFRKKTIEE